MGGFRKWKFLLTFGTLFMPTHWVGGLEKVQLNVLTLYIYGWHLKQNGQNTKEIFFDGQVTKGTLENGQSIFIYPLTPEFLKPVHFLKSYGFWPLTTISE